MDKNAAKDFKKRINDITAFIKEADSKARDGKLVDITHLDMDVGVLCREIEESEPDMAKAVEKEMGEMILALDHLAEGLKQFQNDIAT